MKDTIKCCYMGYHKGCVSWFRLTGGLDNWNRDLSGFPEGVIRRVAIRAYSRGHTT